MSQQASLDALPQEIHAALVGFLPTAACAALAQTSRCLRAAYLTAHWKHVYVGYYNATDTDHPGRSEVSL